MHLYQQTILLYYFFLFISYLKTSYSQQQNKKCDSFCKLCDSNLNCINCNDNLIYDKNDKLCKYNCEQGLYYDPLSFNCVQICPLKHHSDRVHRVCIKMTEIPYLQEDQSQILQIKDIKGILQNQLQQSNTLIVYGNNLFFQFFFFENNQFLNTTISDTFPQYTQQKYSSNDLFYAEFRNNSNQILGISEQGQIFYYQATKLINQTLAPQFQIFYDKNNIKENDNKFLLIENILIYPSQQQNEINYFNIWTGQFNQIQIPSNIGGNNCVFGQVTSFYQISQQLQNLVYVVQQSPAKSIIGIAIFMYSLNDNGLIMNVNLNDGANDNFSIQTFACFQKQLDILQGDHHFYIPKNRRYQQQGFAFIYQDYLYFDHVSLLDEQPQLDITVFDYQQMDLILEPQNYGRTIQFIYDTEDYIFIQYDQSLEIYSGSELVDLKLFNSYSIQNTNLNTIFQHLPNQNNFLSYTIQGTIVTYMYDTDVNAFQNQLQNCDLKQCDYQQGDCWDFCGQAKCCQQGTYNIYGCDGSIGCNGNPCCTVQNFDGIKIYVDQNTDPYNTQIKFPRGAFIQQTSGLVTLYNAEQIGIYLNQNQLFLFEGFQKPHQQYSNILFTDGELFLSQTDGTSYLYQLNQQKFYYSQQIGWALNQTKFSQNYSPQSITLQKTDPTHLFLADQHRVYIYQRHYPHSYLYTLHVSEAWDFQYNITWIDTYQNRYLFITADKKILIYDYQSRELQLKTTHLQGIRTPHILSDNIFYTSGDWNTTDIRTIRTIQSSNDGIYKVCYSLPSGILSQYTLGNMGYSLNVGHVTTYMINTQGTTFDSLQGSSQRFGGDDFSLVFWINMQNTYATDEVFLEISHNAPQFVLQFVYTSTRKIQLIYIVNSTPYQSITTIALTQGIWTSVAFTWDYLEQIIELYLDGIRHIDWDVSAYDQLPEQLHEVYFARDKDNNNNVIVDFLMDQFAIYNTLLTLKEIQCISEQELFYYYPDTDTKQSDDYPKGDPPVYLNPTFQSFALCSFYIITEIQDRDFIFYCRGSGGNIEMLIESFNNVFQYQYDGATCENILHYRNSTQELTFDSFGNILTVKHPDTLITFHREDNIINFWEINNMDPIDNLRPLGILYQIESIQQSLFTFSLLEQNSQKYYIQEYDILDRSLKNTIYYPNNRFDKFEKITPQNPLDQQYLIIKSQNTNNIYKLYPQRQSFQPQQIIELTPNIIKFIQFEGFEDFYYLFLDNNTIQKYSYSSKTLLNTFTLHTSGTTRQHFISYKYKVIISANPQQIVLYFLETETRTILTHVDTEIIQQYDNIIIIYKESEQNFNNYWVYDFIAGANVIDFLLRLTPNVAYLTRDHQRFFQHVTRDAGEVISFFNLRNLFENSEQIDIEFQMIDKLDDYIFKFTYEGMGEIYDMMQIGALLGEFQLNQQKISHLDEQYWRSYPINYMYYSEQQSYLFLKNSQQLFIYYNTTQTNFIFQNNFYTDEIEIENIKIYENQKYILLYYFYGPVLILNYNNIYDIQNRGYQINRHLVYIECFLDLDQGYLIMAARNAILVWDIYLTHQLIIDINLNLQFGIQLLQQITLDLKSNQLIINGNRNITFIEWHNFIQKSQNIYPFNQQDKKFLVNFLQQSYVKTNTYQYTQITTDQMNNNQKLYTHKIHKTISYQDKIIGQTAKGHFIWDQQGTLLNTYINLNNFYTILEYQQTNQQLGYISTKNLLQEISISSNTLQFMDLFTYQPLSQIISITQIPNQDVLILLIEEQIFQQTRRRRRRILNSQQQFNKGLSYLRFLQMDGELDGESQSIDGEFQSNDGEQTVQDGETGPKSFRNRIAVFNFNTRQNRFLSSLPQYTNYYYDPTFMNQYFIAYFQTTLQMYQITGGTVNLTPIKQLDTQTYISQIVLSQNLQFLYILSEPLNTLQVYDFQTVPFNKIKEIPLSYHIDNQVILDQQNLRLIILNPIQINILQISQDYLTYTFLYTLREKQFQTIKEAWLLPQNTDYFIIISDQYIFLIHLLQNNNYQIQLKLYYPQLIIDTLQIQPLQQGSSFQVMLKGIYNYQQIVNFDKEIPSIPLQDQNLYLFYQYQNEISHYQQTNSIKSLISSQYTSFNQLQFLVKLSQQNQQETQAQYHIPISTHDNILQKDNYKASFIGRQSLQEDYQSIGGNFIQTQEQEEILAQGIEINYQSQQQNQQNYTHQLFSNYTILATFMDVQLVFQNQLNILAQNLEEFQYRDLNLQVPFLQNSTLLKFQNISRISFKNFSFQNIELNDSSLLDFENIQSITLDQLTIKNNTLKNFSYKNHLLKFSQVQNIQISNLIIQNNTILEQFSAQDAIFDIVGLKVSSNQNLKIENITLENNKFLSLLQYDEKLQQLDRDIVNYQGDIKIKNIQAYNNSLFKQSLLSIQSHQFSLQNSQFSQISCNHTDCKGSILEMKTTQFNIQSVNFLQNHGSLGSSLYIENCKNIANTINQAQFHNNKAFMGGVIFSNNSFTNITNSVFRQNQAHIGSVIFQQDQNFFLYQNNNAQQRTLQQLNSINNNTAAVQLLSTVLESNTGTLWPNELESYPVKFEIVDQLKTQQKLHMFQSGEFSILELKFFNQQNQPLSLNTKGLSMQQIFILQQIFQLKIFLQQQNQRQNQYMQLQMQDNIHLFSYNYLKVNLIFQFQIFGVPKMYGTFTLNLTYVPKQSQQQSQQAQIQSHEFTVNFQPCQTGQEFQLTQQRFLKCQNCLEGTYSLQPPTYDPNEQYSLPKFCQRCPQYSYTCFKSSIILQNGYWTNVNSDYKTILPCPKLYNCIQQSNYLLQVQSLKDYYTPEICQQGSLGPLCKECDIYGQKWQKHYYLEYNSQTCTICDSQKQLFFQFKFWVKLLIEIWYIQHVVRIAIKMQINQTYGVYLRKMGMVPILKSCFADITSQHVKQFFHYMFLQKWALKGLKIQMSEYLLYFTSIFSSPISIFLNNLDCYFSNHTEQSQFLNVFALRTIYASIIPFLYFLIASFILFLIMKIGKLQKKPYFLYTLGVFLIVYLFPGMILFYMRTIVCIQIDDQTVVIENYTQQCMDPWHASFVFYVVIPLIIIWAILIPLLLFLRVHKFVHSGKKKQWFTKRIKYGFLVGGFKVQQYFWGFMKILKNLTIVVILTINTGKIVSQLVYLYLILFTYLTLIIKYKPYKMTYFNNKEMLSINLLLIFICLNMLRIFSKDQESNTMQFLQYSIITLNQIYFYHLFFMIIYYQISKFIAKYFIKSQKSFLNHLIIFNKPVKTGNILNWKKVSRNLDKILALKYGPDMLKKKNKKSPPIRKRSLSSSSSSSNFATPKKHIFPFIDIHSSSSNNLHNLSNYTSSDCLLQKKSSNFVDFLQSPKQPQQNHDFDTVFDQNREHSYSYSPSKQQIKSQNSKVLSKQPLTPQSSYNKFKGEYKRQFFGINSQDIETPTNNNNNNCSNQDDKDTPSKKKRIRKANNSQPFSLFKSENVTNQELQDFSNYNNDPFSQTQPLSSNEKLKQNNNSNNLQINSYFQTPSKDSSFIQQQSSEIYQPLQDQPNSPSKRSRKDPKFIQKVKQKLRKKAIDDIKVKNNTYQPNDGDGKSFLNYLNVGGEKQKVVKSFNCIEGKDLEQDANENQDEVQNLD